MTETTGGSAGEKVHRALAVPSRRRLIALLREADGALGAAELAAAAALSVATVRHHLAALGEAGLVRACPRPGRPGPGRPSIGWTATASPEPAEAPYRELAGALATALAGHADAARAAGREWGRALSLPGAEPAGQIVTLATRLGFDPELREGGRVLLHGCPYRAMARARPEVVCSVHQGMLDGLLEGTGATAVLHPFLSPGLCSAELHTDS